MRKSPSKKRLRPADRRQEIRGYQRVVTQLRWIGTLAREGSLFDTVGPKRG